MAAVPNRYFERMIQMPQRPADVDVKQSIKDIFFPKNNYHIVDDFVLRDGKRHPVAFLVPGGGYYMVCSFIEGVPIAKKLNEMGISAVIVYYRVKKKALYPAPLEDLARAIREAFARADEYMIETENYSVRGASAGGHLTAAFGTKNMGYPVYDLPKPGALMLAYPVISMTPDLTHKQSHDFFLGKKATTAQEAFTSVEKHVDADYPATFLWCSDDDATVDPDNTRKMKQALEEAGVALDCTVYHGVMHGAGPATGTPAEGWIERAVHFWQKKGKGK